MRTTLTIDDDALAGAKDLAARQRKRVGDEVSELARQVLQPPIANQTARNAIPLLPTLPGTTSVTLELVNQLRNELP